MALKIELNSSTDNIIQRLGICYEWVVQTVQRPDDIQKIMPCCDQGNWPIISLYMKRFSNGVDEILLLIQALKQGGLVTVSAVWQIHPDSIGVNHATRALDVFKAFVEKYGVHLKTANGLTKLVTYQVVGSETTSNSGKWERTFRLPEGVFDAEDHRVTQTPEICLNRWTRQLNVKMHVAVLYNINLSNYIHDMKTHCSDGSSTFRAIS